MRPRLTKYQVIVITTILATVLISVITDGATCFWWLAGLCSLAGTAVGLGVSFPQMQMFGRSICLAPTRRKVVALTFDDGPDPVNTPALLDLLAERKVRATFFCIGTRVLAQPELMNRLVAAEHEIENHTFRHSPATNIFSVRQLRDELSRTQSAIEQTTGRLPEYFRPPMGLTSPRTFRVAAEFELKITGYTARGLDRRDDTPEIIVGRLLRKLQPGAIFLLHDAGVPRERMVTVVTLLLDKLAAEGYQCLRLDELMTTT